MNRFVATLIVTASCASSSVYFHRFDARDRDRASYLRFDRTSATNFYADDGKPCAAAGAYVLGWEAQRSEAKCSHDTRYDGIQPAELSLRWTGVIPSDGDFEIETFDNGLRVWVEAVSRGGWNTDSITEVTVSLQAHSGHCSLTWMDSAAHVASFGPEVRDTYYGGFKEVPTLRLVGCKAGDSLEVRIGLVAQANRGYVEVNAFGFRSGTPDDANRVIGLIARKPGEGVTATQAVCTQVQAGMCTHVQTAQETARNGARWQPPPSMTDVRFH